MPTPSPSMVASVGATTGMSATWPSRPMSPSPVTSATIAVMMGMPAATSAPKVMARITTPAARPIISLRRDLSSESLTPRTPPASTWRPASRAGWAAAMTRPASSRVTWPPFTSSRTWTMAVFSSALMSSDRAPRAKGLVTLVTCGTALIRRTVAWTARLAAGSCRVPSAAWEHHRALAVLLRRELPGQEVGGRLGLSPRQGDVVGRPRAQQHPPAPNHGDDARPHDEHEPPAVRAERSEPVEQCRHAAGILPVTGNLTIRTRSRVST